MTTYKILYYTWSEITFADTIASFQKLGHDVCVVSAEHTTYDNDEEFISLISAKIEEHESNFIFSYDYFPDLSRIALHKGILYISWCYDSPMLTLASLTLNNECNRVFLFDYSLYEKYTKMNFSNIYYMPLACNPERLFQETSVRYNNMTTYKHDISFVGNMYDNEFNFFNQIDYLPEYLKGYLEGISESQMLFYGADIITPSITDTIYANLAKYIDPKLGDLYRDTKRDIIIGMIKKQITAKERLRLLTVLSEFFSLDIYSSQKPNIQKANFCGYAEYLHTMPDVFYTSKINLNITFREIVSGIPLRVIDILGSGGFCLTNFQSEFPTYFTDNENICWFSSREELFEKTVYYLQNDTERKRIAQNGREIAATVFSYLTVLPKILKIALE